MTLRQCLFSNRAVTIAVGLLLAAGASFAQSDTEETAPPWLVAALQNKQAEIDSSVVEPCKTKKEKVIAAEREREQNCADCRDQLPQLDLIEKQAMTRCEIQGLDARIADVEARRKVVIERLKALLKQIQQQAHANDVLTNEIMAGENEAEATFTEAAVGQMMDKLLNLAPDKQIEMIAAAEGRLKDVKAPGRVVKGELGAFVSQLKAELAGKSNAEARAILLSHLDNVKSAVAAVRVSNQVSAQIAAKNLDKVYGVEPDVSGELLDGVYAALLTELQVAKDQSVESVARVVKLNGVLGYSEDTVKIAAVFGNIYQLQTNVDGLSSLLAAAESQRKTAKAELDYLIQARANLLQERSQKQQIATP